MTETMKDLMAPLTADQGYQRHRLVDALSVSVYYTGNQGRVHVRVSAPDGSTSYSHTYGDEYSALQDFATRVIGLRETASGINVGDEVVRTSEPNGPRGMVTKIYKGLNDERLWARVMWGGSVNGYGSPLDTLSPAPLEPPTLDSLMAEELAAPLRDAVRRHVEGGGTQFLDALVQRAEDAAILAEKVKSLADAAEADVPGALESSDYWSILNTLVTGLRAAIGEKS